MTYTLSAGTWLNPPDVASVDAHDLVFTTGANTDFWSATNGFSDFSIGPAAQQPH